MQEVELLLVLHLLLVGEGSEVTHVEGVTVAWHHELCGIVKFILVA